MITPKYLPLILKQVLRNPMRSFLTIGGVASAMFLFIAVQSMQHGVREVTKENAKDTTLVVYREDRFCPFTSRMPEFYQSQIEKVEGVRSVIPMRVVVNNCSASLDVVTFRGVPKDQFADNYALGFELIEGGLADWRKRSDSVLLGETLARRRGLRTGDRFTAAGISTYVAGVFRSDEPQDQNVGYVHLDFLQHAVDKNLGIVTQFNVKVHDPAQLEQVAAAIDEHFASAQDPTSTRSEKAFVAQLAGDMIELVAFTRYMGYGALLAVLALIANSIVMSVQDRIKEHAILQTLGYQSGLVGRLIISEGILLSVLGGLLGTIGALSLIRWSRYSMSVDGLSIPIEANWQLFFVGLAISVLLGVAAGLMPAWRASRRQIADCFRAV